MTSPSQDQDLRTALAETVERMCRVFVGPAWEVGNVVAADYYRARMHEVLRAITPAQAPDKAGEREGVAEAQRELAFFVDCVKALMRHTNPTNVNEGHAQQWFAVSDAIRMKIEPLIASLPAPAGDVPGEAQTQAARDVLAERRRQVEAEGWTPEHDAEHSRGEMATAAACYAFHAGAMQTEFPTLVGISFRRVWPWDWAWWKPSDARRDLVKAGALILAEIERLDRSPGEAQTLEGRR